MVFVCSICTSSLSTRPVELLPGVNIELMTTRCGHLFHLACLNNWFNHQDHPARHCPNCNEVLAAADTIIVRPSGDNDADEDTLIQENARLTTQVSNIQDEINQTQTLLFETLEKSSVEVTQNDMLCREIEKLEMQLRKMKQKNEETDEMLKVNEDSFKTELIKLTKEKKYLEENLDRAEASGFRLKHDLDEQLRSKNQRIADLELNANELRKSNEYWRQQHNRLRRRDGHIDQDDDFMMSQATQTDNPEMMNLDERLLIYKRCLNHMHSECKILEKMRLREAAAPPTPQPGPRTFLSEMEKLGISRENSDGVGQGQDHGRGRKAPAGGLFNGNGDTGLFDEGQVLRPREKKTQDVKPKIELSASAPPFHPSNPPAKVKPNATHLLENNAAAACNIPNPHAPIFDKSADVKIEDDFGFLHPKLTDVDSIDVAWSTEA